MRKILFVSILLFGFYQLKAQKISGIVQNDSSKTPLEFAVVTLLNVLDSSQLALVTSNNVGAYKFSNIKKGEYILQVTFVGFHNYSSVISLANDSSDLSFDINLKEKISIANTVTIKATKSAIKQEAGKTTVDVKSMSAATGLMALDLLRRMPGVIVDNSDNIILKGKSNVSIMLNGKMTYMSTKQIAMILKSMPASEIDNIEIISTPSAKYDAQGAGGIININLKKSVKKGFYGNVQVTSGQGFYWKENGGVTVAYNSGKLRLNASVNLNDHLDRSVSNNFRSFGVLKDKYTYDQKAIFQSLNKSASYNFGASYDINSKLTVGVSHYGVAWSGIWSSNEGGTIQDSLAKIIQLNDTRAKEPYHGYSLSSAADFTYKLDSTGSISGAFNHNYEFGTSNLDATIYRNLNSIVDTAFYNSHLPSYANSYAVNADFEKKYFKKLTLEAGAKWVCNVRSYNMDYGITQKVKFVPAIPTSVRFDYNEQISAAYVQGAWNEKKWGVKGGLRCEDWTALGVEKLSNTSFTRNFLQFFPSAAINFNASDKHNFSFAYNKRIRRPSDNMMSPVSYFTDPYSLFSGNPKVLPYLSHNFELSHSLAEGTLITTVGYTRGQNYINEYSVSQRDTSSVIDMTTINIPLHESMSLSMSFYKALNKWWTLQFFGMVVDNRLAGYLSNFKTNVDNSYISSSYSTTNTFTLPKQWTIEVSGFYQMKHLAGYTINSALGNFGLAVKKEIFAGRGSLKLNCVDVFHTFKYSGTSDVNGFKRSYLYYWDNQVVYLSFNWKLGSKWFLHNDAKK